MKSIDFAPIAYLPHPSSKSGIDTERETFEDEKKNKHVVRKKSMSYAQLRVHNTLVQLPQAKKIHFDAH